MNYHDRALRGRRGARVATVVFLFALLPACGAAAQAAASQSAASQSAAAPAITIGAELRGGSYLAMPNVSLLLTAGFPVANNRLEIVPRVGGTYLFFPMSGLSGNWYVPVGLELRFLEKRLGIVVENLVSIDNIFGEGGVTAGLEGYFPLGKPGRNAFSMAVEAGTAVFWNTANKPLVLVNLSASLRYAHQLKAAS